MLKDKLEKVLEEKIETLLARYLPQYHIDLRGQGEWKGWNSLIKEDWKVYNKISEELGKEIGKEITLRILELVEKCVPERKLLADIIKYLGEGYSTETYAIALQVYNQAIRNMEKNIQRDLVEKEKENEKEKEISK